SEGSFSEDTSHDYFRQIMDGISYCHSVGVAHRDIKPENLLLTDTGVVKITDFGLAVSMLEGTLLYRAAGTPAYLAPEVIRCHGYDGRTADVWSCGVVLYVFIIERCELKYPQEMPDQVKDLLRKILVSDPGKRFCAKEVLDHEWTRKEPRVTKRSTTVKDGSPGNQMGDGSLSMTKPMTTLDLLQMSDLFDVSGILSRSKRRITKFMTRKSRDEVMKRLTAILCTLPLTFTAVDVQNKINIQAPFANEMIVMIVQLHVMTEGLLIVDFHRLKGDAEEAFQLFKEISTKVQDIIMLINK
ncbi:kinase-like domain-containing protein, partial [Chytridium lagenaria]